MCFFNNFDLTTDSTNRIWNWLLKIVVVGKKNGIIISICAKFFEGFKKEMLAVANVK